MVIKKGEIEFDDETNVCTVKLDGKMVNSFVSEVRAYGNNAQIAMAKKDGEKRVIVIVDP